jgi:phosphoglycerate dehydrogenase-like enzyme
MPSNTASVLIVEPPERDYMARPILEDLRRSRTAADRVASYGEADLTAVEVLVSPVCGPEIMARAPNLQAVINPYTGSEHIDRAEASRRGIIIGVGQTRENVSGMAEATLLLLLDAFYDLKRAEQTLRDGAPRPPIRARLLAGKTVGLLGFGHIARAVAERLAGWGVELLVSAPRLSDLPPHVAPVPLEALLGRSDAVLVLCSLNDSTRNLLDRERLALMKPGAVLVNTARGGIIDEAALEEAARSGRIGRLALDAFTVEPLPMDSPLRRLPDTVLTPHMIGHTIEAEQSMQRTAAESVRRVLAGAPPFHTLNPDVLPAWSARCANAAGEGNSGVPRSQ